MAKNRNKKYRPTYTTDGRVDMRTGGRVKLKHGGRPLKKDYIVNGELDELAYDAAVFAWQNDPAHTADNGGGNGGGGSGDDSSGGGDDEEGSGDIMTDRQDRVGRTGQRIEDIATGQKTLEDIGAQAEAALTDEFRNKQEETITGENVAIAKDTELPRLTPCEFDG